MTTTKDAGTVIVDHVIGDRGRLAIHLTSAEIRLAATDGDRVIVRTPADKSAERVTLETTDDGLAIRDKESSGLSFGRGRRVVQLEIEVPALAEITINTTSGWLDAIGLRGEQRYKTTSGEFRLRDGAGQIDLNTVSGDAQIELAAPTELSIKSVSGDVTVGGGRLDALRIGTTSGDIRIDSPLTRSTDNRIETLSGDVQLVTIAGLRVEARTVSGDLTTNLPHRSEGRMGRRTLIIGDGSIELAFRSVSGDLRIHDGSARSVSPVPPIPPIAPRPPVPPIGPFGPGFDLPEIDLPDLELPDFGPAGWPSKGPQTPAAATTPSTTDPRETERMTILRALEQGELDVATAMDRLAALDDETDAGTDAGTEAGTDDDRGHLL